MKRFVVKETTKEPDDEWTVWFDAEPEPSFKVAFYSPEYQTEFEEQAKPLRLNTDYWITHMGGVTVKDYQYAIWLQLRFAK